mmetsp:Transcript_5678/g.8406  ORF Transcript_5678/g.8406 Transcript_5678/m.8406 type:complete len:204 (+) Transcript_5678:21-632(+)
MKFSVAASIFIASAATSSAFSITTRHQLRSLSLCPSKPHVSNVSPRNTRLSMESDFASGMPEKPEVSLQEQLIESATTFIADIENRLGEGVEAPPVLEELRTARDDNADVPVLTAKIYELMIEQGMTYDQDPDTGALTTTTYDVKANLEIPEVKSEFAYLYKYGMTLIAKGVVDVDTVKSIVTERLIERTGLTPEKFDEWLGY